MTVTPVATPRQTIPYADRPMVDPRSGRSTIDFYQYLERLRVAAAATITNVTNVITATNANAAQITTILADLATIEAEIAAIQAEIAALQALEAPPPVYPPVRPFPVDFPPWSPPRPFPLPLYGTTALRPVSPALWTTYGDTDLGIPIWWNGTAWVNALGAPV